MKHSIITFSLAFSLILCVSCQGPGNSQLRAEWPQIVERARARVLAELPNLDVTSREMIRTNYPKLYFVGVPFGGDYQFVWMISSNRTVELEAYTDYRNVDGKPVRILETVPNPRYW